MHKLQDTEAEQRGTGQKAEIVALTKTSLEVEINGPLSNIAMLIQTQIFKKGYHWWPQD